LFGEECSEFVHRRKQAKLQWLQDQRDANEDNLSDVRREASRHFRKKEGEYLKAKIKELNHRKGKNSRDLYRGINKFKNCYQPRTNLVKTRGGCTCGSS
jgi:hypothetical protein